MQLIAAPDRTRVSAAQQQGYANHSRVSRDASRFARRHGTTSLVGVLARQGTLLRITACLALHPRLTFNTTRVSRSLTRSVLLPLKQHYLEETRLTSQTPTSPSFLVT